MHPEAVSNRPHLLSKILLPLWAGKARQDLRSIAVLMFNAPPFQPVEMPSGAVFLSYASQDAESAKWICEALLSETLPKGAKPFDCQKPAASVAPEAKK